MKRCKRQSKNAASFWRASGLRAARQSVSVRRRSDGEGRGSTFAVHLPATVVRRASGKEPQLHPTAASGLVPDFRPLDLTGITVLVVDDEPDARLLLERVLTECRAHVIVAENGEGALQAVETHRPHVLVTDIGMPQMDGYELLRRSERSAKPWAGSCRQSR
jgi:PleD family two-component response regulator